MSSLFVKYGIMAQTVASAPDAKVFEVDDVLPATTALRIAWPEGYPKPWPYNSGAITMDSNFMLHYDFDDGDYGFAAHFFGFDSYDVGAVPTWDRGSIISPYTNGGAHDYIDVDTSSWLLSKRTVHSVDYGYGATTAMTWQDMNA